MAERQNPFRNIRVVVRPGTKKLKILIIVLVLVCAVALGAVHLVSGSIRAQTQAELEKAAALERENAELADKQNHLGSSDSIKDIAREELGLADPDTVIIDPNSQ